MASLKPVLLSSFALALGGTTFASTTVALFGEGGAAEHTLEAELFTARSIGMPLVQGIHTPAAEADTMVSTIVTAPLPDSSSGSFLISTGTLEAVLDSTFQTTHGLSVAVMPFNLADSALRADLARR